MINIKFAGRYFLFIKITLVAILLFTSVPVFVQIMPLGPEVYTSDPFVDQSMMPAIAMASDGSYVVTWFHRNNTSSAVYQVSATLFLSDGTSKGPFIVSTNPKGNHWNPRVAMADDGAFVIAWIDWEYRNVPNTKGVYLRRFDNKGNPIDSTEILIHTGAMTYGYTYVGLAGDGSAGVIYSADDETTVQMVDPAGNLTGTISIPGTVSFGEGYHPFSMSPDGSFVVAYTHPYPEKDIYAVYWDASQGMLLREIPVTDNISGSYGGLYAGIADDNSFTVFYMDVPNADDSLWYISVVDMYAARYDGSGKILFNKWLYTTAADAVALPYEMGFAVAADGTFSIAWASKNINTRVMQVNAMVFDSGGTPVEQPFEVNQDRTNGKYYVASGMNADKLAVAWMISTPEQDYIVNRLFSTEIKR